MKFQYLPSVILVLNIPPYPLLLSSDCATRRIMWQFLVAIVGPPKAPAEAYDGEISYAEAVEQPRAANVRCNTSYAECIPIA